MDEQLKQAIKLTIENDMGSTSYLQRKMKLNYNDASKLMDQMEEMGVVSEFLGAKPRKVLIKSIDTISYY